jgi:hypothetical protein
VLNKAIADLERSGLDQATAEAAGMYTEQSARDVYGEFHRLPALVIPYYDPETGELMEFKRGNKMLPFARVRYLETPPARRGKKPQRYAQPNDSGVFPYFPMGTDINWGEVLADTRQKIVITEGEKKALAGCLAGVPTVGLGGVFNYLDKGALLPALRLIKWKKRKVFLNFDSDAATNPNIMTAEARLAEELARRQGAKVHLVRLPDAADGSKQGIDDYIVENGVVAWHQVLEDAPFMGTLDVEVAKLNEDVAWVEQEGKAFELATNIYITKDNLVSGSTYSTRQVIVPNPKGNAPKQLSVAKSWLTHPHALRYKTTVFDPSTSERTLQQDGGIAYNLWDGWEHEDGDVTPFLRLHKHVFSTLPADLRDFPLKLMAYKFQNPHLKIPLALVFIGMQGSGKSLWAAIMREAAGHYGKEVQSEALLSEFNGWLEDALIVVMDEAKPEHVSRGASTLKRLISEDTEMLNEKYRVARQLKQYAQFIITSNDRRVGYYDSDDRRMFVAECADPHPEGERFYLPIVDWKKYERGAAKVCHYLLNYDLKGWVPPARAPMTHEKYMALMENSSPVQRLAEEMKTADQSVVLMWLTQGMMSARIAETSSDQAVAARGREYADALSRIPVRPFYTQDELAMIFPMVIQQLYGNKRLSGTPAGEISRQLRECGIKYLKCTDDPRGFKKNGRLTNYLIIADMHDIPHAMSQNELDRQMRMFPTFGELTK